MKNQKIICKDCNKEFIFTIGEQKFYKEKGFETPVRCKDCRRSKKNNYTHTGLTELEKANILKRWKANTIKI